MPTKEEIKDAIEFLSCANLTSDQAHCIDVLANGYEWESSRAHTLKTQFDKLRERDMKKLKEIHAINEIVLQLEGLVEQLICLRIDRGFESFDEEGKETSPGGKATIEEMIVTEGSEAHHQVVAYCEANGYGLTSRRVNS